MFSSWYLSFLVFIAAGILVICANDEDNHQTNRFNRADRDYRPLQFGKRDSFRPLQFGKKDNYRPLQFGKRGSFHPYAVYSTFNDLAY